MATKAQVKGSPAKVAATKAQVKDAPEEGSKEVAVIKLNQKALSTDIGEAIVKQFAEAYELDANIAVMKVKSENTKHLMLSQMTTAILKAANADDAVDLSLVFSGDQKKMNFLNDQLLIAMGVREQVNVAKNGKEPKLKVQYTDKVAGYFPSAKDDKDSDEYKRKNNMRSNFVAVLKRAAQSAYGMIEEGIEAKFDKKANTLQITGKAVKKHFGQESVLLNEKQTVTVGTGDKAQKVKLAAKPSFSEIANIGAAHAGKTLQSRKEQGTSGKGTNVTDADGALIAIAGEFHKALNLFKGVPSDKLRAELAKVGNAIVAVSERKPAAEKAAA